MNNLLFQNSLFIGISVSQVLYGIELALYYLTMRIYFKQRGHPQPHSTLYMAFSTVQLILVTIFISTQSLLGLEMWVTNAGYPGGAAAYFDAHITDGSQILGTVAATVRELMSDALMIHRCYTLWGGSYWILAFLALLWLSTLFFGFYQNLFSLRPGANFFTGRGRDVVLVYFCTTIFLHTVTTALICGRIIYCGNRLARRFGPDVSKTYFSIANIVIESVLPYTLAGIAFIVSYGLENDTSVFFLFLYAMFTCIFPQILILRVASGRAWTGSMAECEMSVPAVVNSDSALHLSSRPSTLILSMKDTNVTLSSEVV